MLCVQWDPMQAYREPLRDGDLPLFEQLGGGGGICYTEWICYSNAHHHDFVTSLESPTGVVTPTMASILTFGGGPFQADDLQDSLFFWEPSPPL